MKKIFFLALIFLSVNCVAQTDNMTKLSKHQLETIGKSSVNYYNLINTPDFYWGRENLRNFDAAVGQLEVSTLYPKISISVIGDSWNWNTQFQTTFRKYIYNQYGYNGGGYVGCQFAAPLPDGVTRSQVGTGWTNHITGEYGVSLCYAKDTVVNDSIIFVTNATEVIIHYLKQVGGGSFAYRVDGGSQTTVNTSNASTDIGFVYISGLSSTASHTISMKTTVKNTVGVIYLGLDIRKNGTYDMAGARVNNIAMTGSTSGDWIEQDDDLWNKAFDSLNTNLAIIMLGVNDCAGDVAPKTFKSNIKSLISRIRTAAPGVSILLVTQTDISGASTAYPLSDYVDELKDLSIEDTTGFVNNYKLIGDYATANTNGLYTNTTHLTATGYSIIAKNVIDYLFQNKFSQIYAQLLRPSSDQYSLSVGGTNFSTLTTGLTNYFGGYGSGVAITSGSNNVGIGIPSLASLTTGSYNTSIGTNATGSMTTTTHNTSVGYGANRQVTGGYSTAIGSQALYTVGSAVGNTFVGWGSGYSVTGGYNTGIGRVSGYNLTTGTYNVFIGNGAGNNGSQKTDATNSISIGYNTYTTKSNQVILGNTDIVETLLRGAIVVSVSDTTPIVAGTGVTAAMYVKTTLRVIGAAGAASDITANPQIVDGVDGQILILTGSSDTKTVKFDDGTGLATNGNASRTLGKGDKLCLQYDAVDDIWYELYYSDN